MLIDITYLMKREVLKEDSQQKQSLIAGHYGTHIDTMNSSFPLEYCLRPGIFFDVTQVQKRDIEIDDIDLSRVKEGMFVGFYTAMMEEYGYLSEEYKHNHPQLSEQLIDALLGKKISMIGIDCAGVRRGKQHTPMDKKCADQGTFIVENLCGLHQVVNKNDVMVYTFPMNLAGFSGLPTRVVVEIGE